MKCEGIVVKTRTLRLKGQYVMEELEAVQGELDALTLLLLEDGLPRNCATDTSPKLYLIDAQDWQGEDYSPPWSRYNNPHGRKQLKIDAFALSFSSAAAGELAWQPIAAHMDTAGHYVLEVTLLDSGGHLLKWPTRLQRIYIRPSPSAP